MFTSLAESFHQHTRHLAVERVVNRRELKELVVRLATYTPTRTEADVQADVRTLLLSDAFSLEDSDLELTEAGMETQVGDGTFRRIDVEAGYCVIEVKKKLTPSVIAKVVDEQLAGYVRTREAQTDARYTGLLTDGNQWKLYRLDANTDTLVEVRSITVDGSDPQTDRLLAWLESVFATNQNLKVTPDAVTEQFGADSPGFALNIATLTDLYESAKHHSDVRLKRELWAKSLETAFGTQFVNSDELFVNHTYLVTIGELVAHATIGFDIVDLDPKELLIGTAFSKQGFRGVVEADFFDWVADTEDAQATEDGYRFVRELARRVDRYDWTNVQHDVLKALYESVITADTRHALGEYYTPDFLADMVVAATVTDPLTQRVLDPSCGSGTFLFAAIRHLKAAAERDGLDPADVLRRIVTNVIGMDLHPVAVTLARVTYLLAIGPELYPHRTAAGVTIPVFLGDSLQWERGNGIDDHVGDLVVATKGDETSFESLPLRFPERALRNAERFDELVTALSEKATSRKRKSAHPVLDEGFLDKYDLEPDDRPMVRATFTEMCGLHDNLRNHIWGYYVRNLARPQWLARPENRVDCLIGNPPWLANNAMSPKLQESVKTLGKCYDIRPKSNLVGSSDLSATFVVAATELYLRDEGHFGFVMPRGALGGPHYENFRTGAYPADTELSVAFTEPWDLAGLLPHMFPVPACAIFGTKSGTSVPMPDRGVAKIGRWDVQPDQLDGTIASENIKITRADKPESPYHDLSRKGADLYPRSIIGVERVQAGPLGGRIGTVAVQSRRGGDKEPWKSLPDMSGAIEEQFLRSVLLGAKVVHYGLLAPEEAVVPWNGTELMNGTHPEMNDYPGLSAWWSEAEARWDKHSSGKMTLIEQVDYQSKLTNQHPTAPLRVVYTASGTYLAAAVLADESVLVDKSLYWMPVKSLDEAHYLTAILNSDALLDLFSPLQSTGQFGTRDFSRYPLYPNVPLFDPTNELHTELSACGTQAETVVADIDLADTKFQQARKQIRTHLADTGYSANVDALVSRLVLTAVD